MNKLLGSRHLLKLYNSMNGSSNQYIIHYIISKPMSFIIHSIISK
jgi:hypothetical protein